MQISGHIGQHIKLEKRSLNTKTPRMLSKLLTMHRKYTAICINVALKTTRMSSYVTSTLRMNSKHGSPLVLRHLSQYLSSMYNNTHWIQISGHIGQHIKLEKGSLNTNTPRMLSKLLNMDRKFTAIWINVALKMTRISLYVTSTLKISLSGITIFWMSVILWMILINSMIILLGC